MKLTGEKWENYSTKAIDKNNERPHDEYWEEETLKTISVGELMDKARWMKENAEVNHLDPYQVPVFITNKNVMNSLYCFTEFRISSDGTDSIGYWEDDKLEYTAPDSRPEGGGEFWASRGPSWDDVSGFVKSKKAGERLQRLVNLILETDHPKTHLDYREYEPSWIQFKFSADEFDVEKLDKLTRDNNGVITEKIIRDCVKKNLMQRVLGL